MHQIFSTDLFFFTGVTLSVIAARQDAITSVLPNHIHFVAVIIEICLKLNNTSNTLLQTNRIRSLCPLTLFTTGVLTG